jgi:hypothetical protein
MRHSQAASAFGLVSAVGQAYIITEMTDLTEFSQRAAPRRANKPPRFLTGLLHFVEVAFEEVSETHILWQTKLNATTFECSSRLLHKEQT